MNYLTHRILSLESSHCFNINIEFFLRHFNRHFSCMLFLAYLKKQTIFRKLKTDFIAPYYSNVFIKQLLTVAS